MLKPIDALEPEALRALVQQSGLFDPTWYLARNHDVRQSGRDPLDHFAWDGAREGRDPGPAFDTLYYVDQHSGADNTGLSAFEHFLRFGQQAGIIARRPEASASDTAEFAALVSASGLFDPAWYLAHNSDVRRSGLDPLDHFAADGARERRDPGPGFDTAAYVKRAGDVDFTAISPIEHHLRTGGTSDGLGGAHAQEQEFRELLRESGLFNASWYLAHNHDLRRPDIDPFDHQVRYGAGEGRNPGPGFDATFYAEQNPGVFASGLSPLEHYLRVGRAAGSAPRGVDPYTRWVARFDELTASDRERISSDAIVSPLPAIACLHVLADGASEAEEITASLTAQIGATPEIRLVAPQGGFNTPARALDDLPDDAVAILSGGRARLRPHAVYALVNALVRERASAAYSDHDHETASGRRTRPVFKPTMSPDFMARRPYAGPVVAIRVGDAGRDRIGSAIEMAARGNPAVAFAALLMDLDSARVRRVPLPLYSLPAGEDTEEEVEDFRPVALEAAENRADPDVEPAHRLPRVAIIIPTRDRREILEACVDSVLAKTNYPLDHLRIVVIDNSSHEPDTLTYLRRLADRPGCAVVLSPGPFNFSKICNDGAAAAEGEVLVFLNNDMTVISPDWLAALVAQAMRPTIGVVGAQLLYPDETVQHGGVLVGLEGVAGHYLQGVPADEARRRDATRELTAVTGACLAVRRVVFEEIGGFDEALAVAFNDVALCMRAHEAGYRNLYLARPLLYHHESKSRGYDDTPEKLDRNLREAIYARERFGSYFRDDPAYNPNLSLVKPGKLAVSPRVVRPWRRSPTRRALILSVGHGLGHGVGRVVALQAEQLLARGWGVAVGGPTAEGDRPYLGCNRVKLETAADAAAFAVAEGFDCVIAHTPPFFSVTRHLGRRPLFYAYDHGEPPPDLFDDRTARERIDWEKRFCVPLAHRVFCISQAIHAQQYRRDAVVLRNGNAHLATWSAEWANRRADLRRKFGFEGRFVVLDVCRFHSGERRYKGVDAYAALACEFPYTAPAAGRTSMFVLAGRGDEEDVAYVRAAGLTVFPNVSDAEMAELYAASDLYVGLSRWEGYDLGVGQALAMGLDVVASDIPAHREFGVPVATSTPELCGLVSEAFERWDPHAAGRAPRIESWDEPLTRMVDLLEEDLKADAAGPWL